MTITDSVLSCKPYPLAYKRRVRWGLYPTNHNTQRTHDVGYYPHGGSNLSKTIMSLMLPLFSTFVSTHTLDTCHKPRQLAPTVGLTRIVYVRSMTFTSTSKFLPDSKLVFRSLLFITDKFGDLSLQEPELQEVIGSGTDRVPPIPGSSWSHIRGTNRAQA
jgi:hypothetical protein